MKNIPLVIVFPPKNHKARKAIYYEYCASYGQFAVCVFSSSLPRFASFSHSSVKNVMKLNCCISYIPQGLL